MSRFRSHPQIFPRCNCSECVRANVTRRQAWVYGREEALIREAGGSDAYEADKAAWKGLGA